VGILKRYLSGEFLKLMGFFLFIFVCIYLLIEFIQRLDNVIEEGAPVSSFFAYLLYKTPFITVNMLPIAVMLSVIVLFCLMKKHNELTAMKACGLSIFDLSKPALLISILIAGASFLFSELLVPFATAKSNEIWNVQIKKRDQTRLYGRNDIWYKGSNSIYWIRLFDSEKGKMEDVSLYFFDESFGLVKRIDALRGVWAGDHWEFRQGIIQTRNAEGGYDLEKFEELDLPLPEGPEAFAKTMKEPEEMSYWELKHFAEKVQLEGYDATPHLVAMNIKLAFPVINFIMALIGIPIALRVKRGGTAVAISLGIGVCFLYLLLLGLARSLGLSGTLPPVISAWLANVVFFFLGSYVMMHVET